MIDLFKMKKVDFFKKFSFWIFIIVISISFIAYFGISGDIGSGGYGVEVGSIDGKVITNSAGSEYNDIYRGISNYYVSQNVPVTGSAQSVILRQAFDRVVNRTLSIRIAKSMNIEVDDSETKDFVFENYFGGDREFQKRYFEIRPEQDLLQIYGNARNALLQEKVEKFFLTHTPVSENEVKHLIEVGSFRKDALVGEIDLSEAWVNFVPEQDF